MKNKQENSKTRNGISPILGIVVIALIITVAGAGVFYSMAHPGSAVGTGLYVQTTPSSTTRESVTTTAAPASSGPVQVQIVQGAHSASQSQHFVPETITVVIGVNNTVEWTNLDIATHTVTANNGAFDSGDLASGATFKFTFTTPGTFAYHCNIHPFMTGTIIVIGPSGQHSSMGSNGVSGPTVSGYKAHTPTW